MRRKLARGVTAALLAMAVTLTGHAAPAQAATTRETIDKIIDYGKKAADLIKKLNLGGVSEAALRAAVQEIVTAVENAKIEIISHIDAIAAAEVRACVRHHVIEFADIDRFAPTVLQSWAQDATGCASLADSLFRAVSDKAAADNIGFALNTIMPIALTARARAGLTTSTLMSTFNSSEQVIISKLAPTCTEHRVEEPPMLEIQYYCVAYNGDTAYGDQIFRNGKPLNGPVDKDAVAAEATRLTSRAVARAVLPYLV